MYRNRKHYLGLNDGKDDKDINSEISSSGNEVIGSSVSSSNIETTSVVTTSDSRTPPVTPPVSSMSRTLLILRQVIAANLSMLVRTFSLLGCWAVATSVCARVGATHVAAHQVALSLYLLFSLFGEAPAVAGQVMMARYMALGQKKEARALFKRLTQICLGVGALASVLTYGSAFVVPLMLSNGEEAASSVVLNLVYGVMPIAAVQQPLVALVLVMEALVTGCRAFQWIAMSTTVAGGIIASSMIACLNPHILMPYCRTGFGVKQVWNHITALFCIRLLAALGRLWYALRLTKEEKLNGGAVNEVPIY